MSFNGRLLKTSLLVWAVTGVALVALMFWPPEALARALARANLSFPYLLTVSLVWALTPLAALIWRHLGALVLGALLLSALVPRGIDQVSPGAVVPGHGTGPQVPVAARGGPGGGRRSIPRG